MLAITLLTMAWIGPASPSAERSARLESYRDRRAGAAADLPGQLALARWCQAHALPIEASAHFTAVTRLRPDHPEARSALGHRRFEGRWLTDAEIARLVAERREQGEADRRYRPWLESWRDWVHRGRDVPRAAEALDGVTDPRAVPAIREVFARGDASDQTWAVRMFRRIDSPEATLSLGMLALNGRAAWVRERALAALDGRDPRVYVGLLINRLRDPVRFEVRGPSGRDEVGEILVDLPGQVMDRVYDAPAPSPIGSPSSGVASKIDPAGTPRRPRRDAVPDAEGAYREDRAAHDRAEGHMLQDALRLERDEFATASANEQLLLVLRRATGQDLGADQSAWASWWTDQLGYPARSPEESPGPRKPIAVVHVQAAAPRFVAPRARAGRFPPPRRIGSCFAAGTPVETETGSRPIEALEVGDLVLSLDTATGRAGYSPVVRTLHNPPAATLRVDLGPEAISATGIHRFWRSGDGWIMARDLRPGDRLRLADGEARVASVSPERVRPVFNLEVLDHADFFVGESRALVHDNTIAAPVSSAFDRKVPAVATSGR